MLTSMVLVYFEVCLNWNHRRCVNMRLEDYFHWSQIEDGWVCPRCDRGALPFHNVSQLSSSSSNLTDTSFSSTFASPNSTNTACPSPLQLSVFYFNARSLPPKIDQVRALCANEHYDLVVVVEHLYTIGGFYRPPNSGSDYMSKSIVQLHSFILRIFPTLSSAAILISTSHAPASGLHQPLNQIFSDFCLSQVVSEPTRVTDSTASTIDLVLMSNSQSLDSCHCSSSKL